MNEKERIEKIMQLESMTSGQFAQEIGVQNSTLSHILNDRNNPSLDVIKKILNRFPIINSDWLILGQGPMLRQELHSQTPTLFGFDEENYSLSDDSSKSLTKNNHQGLSSSERNNIGSTDGVPILPISQFNEPAGRKQTSSFNVSETIETLSKETISIHTPKSGISNENLPYDEKKVTKIILYYSDNKFQEFESK